MLHDKLDALASVHPRYPRRGVRGKLQQAVSRVTRCLVRRWRWIVGLLIALYPLYSVGRHAVTSGLLDQNVKGSVMVVYARCGLFSEDDCAGMMSEFFAVLGALKYAETHGAVGVRPQLDTPMYLDPSMGSSWWQYFFTPRTMWLDETAATASAPEVHLNSYMRRYGRLGGFGHIVYGEKGYLYPMTFGLERHETARLWSKYSGFVPKLEDKVNGFVDKHLAGAPWVLGVHYRGLDTVQHYPYYKIEYGYFWDEMVHVLTHYGKTLPPGLTPKDAPHPADDAYDYVIFVATDEAEFLEQTRDKFAPVPVVAWASPRKSASSTVPLHKDHSLSNYIKGESVLIDAKLLSHTDYLIKGRSGVSEASLIFNPELPYSFFISRSEIYRDSMPSSGNPQRLAHLPKPG